MSDCCNDLRSSMLPGAASTMSSSKTSAQLMVFRMSKVRRSPSGSACTNKGRNLFSKSGYGTSAGLGILIILLCM